MVVSLPVLGQICVASVNPFLLHLSQQYAKVVLPLVKSK